MKKLFCWKPISYKTILLTLLLFWLAIIGAGIYNKISAAKLASINSQTVTFDIGSEKIVDLTSGAHVLEGVALNNNIPESKHNTIAKSQENKATTQAAESKVDTEPKNPVIAIIITGLGLSSSATKDVLSLPSTVTLGVSPYGSNLDALAEQAEKEHRILILDLPLEPEKFPIDDAGPFALLTSLPMADNIDRLKNLTKMLKNNAGFYTLGREKFTASEYNIIPVLQEMKKENLLFLYAGGLQNNILNQIAAKISFPLLTSDLVIDEDMSEDKILLKLGELEKIAQEKGVAIGVGHSYPITIKNLLAWINKLSSTNIKIMNIVELQKLNIKNNY